MFLVKVGRTYRKLDNSDDISELIAPTITSENSREFDPEAKLEHEDWFYMKLMMIICLWSKNMGTSF